MFYNNEFSENKMNTKTAKIESFKNSVNTDIDKNILPFASSPMCFNFNYEDGSLKDGIGVKELEFRCSEVFSDRYKLIEHPSDSSFEKGCWLFTAWTDETKIHRPYLIIYTSYGDFYYNRIHSNSTELVKMEGLHFEKKPMVTSCKINGVDTLILFSEEDGMYTWRYPSYVQKIENAPSISSMCVHDNRLFATTNGEKRMIMFSDSLDPTNFNMSVQQGGVIELADEFGRSNKVLSFEGYVYVFRDFNIVKLSTYSDKNDFSISQLYVSNGRIYDKTVCICGNKILYLASDGLYEFNGTSATKINLNVNKLFAGVDNLNAVAGYSDGFYYLACTLNYDDDYIIGNEPSYQLFSNNALLKINVKTGDTSILRGYDIRDISVINDIYKSEVSVLIQEKTGGFSMGLLTNNGMYFDKPTTKIWKSASTDFGVPEKYKVVKEISLETQSNIAIEIVTESGSKSFSVMGRTGYQTIKPYVKGKNISIYFKSETSGNKISNPKVTVGYL